NKTPIGMKTCQQKHNTLAAGMTTPNSTKVQMAGPSLRQSRLELP
nr:hypothetical protein [Tanacetum cinerariifolium]